MATIQKITTILTTGFIAIALTPAFGQTGQAQLVASIERHEIKRTENCIMGQFRHALNLAYSEDKVGAYREDKVESIIESYKIGQISADGTSTLLSEIRVQKP